VTESFATPRRVARPVRLGAIAIGLLAVALATRTTITSLEWIGRTFPGFVFIESRVVAAIGLPGWSGAEVPGLYLSQIVAVDERPVDSAQEIVDEVARRPAGSTVRYRIRTGGEEHEVAVKSQVFTGRDWLLLFGAYLLNGVVFMVSGLLSWALRPESPLARAFLAFGGSCAVFLFTAMDLYGPSTFYHLYLLANALVPAAALELALLFPQPHRFSRWRFAGYPVALVVFLLYELWLDAPGRAAQVFVANTVYLGMVGVFFGSRLIAEYWRGRSELARQRVRVITLGTVLGLTLPGLILVLASFVGGGVGMNALLFTFFVFPLSLAYAIVKHDLFEIDAMIKRAAYYLLLTGSVGLTYAAAVLLFQIVLNGSDLVRSPAFPVLFTLAVLLLFNPLRSRLQGFVDRVFFRTSYDGAKVLATVGSQLASTRRRDEIIALVRRSVDAAIPSAGVQLYFTAGASASLDNTRGASVPPAMTAELAQDRVLTSFDPPEHYADEEAQRKVRKELTRLAAEVAVPMRLRGKTIGALLLGAKRSGLFYTAGDVEFLRALVQEAAIALENAASYEELVALNARLEERVEERTGQLKAANTQLEKSNVELARAYGELKNAEVQLVQSEKMASLGRLAAGVAHEINNPVSFIASNIEPLRTRLDEALGAPPERAAELLGEARELAAIMGRGAERTAAIVKDLRSFSRLGEAKRKTVDLREGIDVTIRLLESRWRGRVVIHRNYAELPPVECDSGQINQVFMNLLANALDAIDGKGNIWIATVREGDAIVVSIRDDGRGIAPAELGRVFDPFYTTKDVGGGTGLGLAIVHGIVTAHDGRVDVESTLGAGSTFRVSLPLRMHGEHAAARGAG